MKRDHYQIIARKYRPQTFAHVIGQEAIVTTLKNSLRLNRLAHAYLFCGCRGTGKTTLARVFAKALNCSSPSEDFEPCNACSSCLDINAGRSLDVLEIDGASNRGIDDIRQINETIGYAAASGKYKIYIIDEVHMLTKEAFNALLKTLEEPPANVKFLLATTEPHKVLPTIISRCQRFDLNRIPLEALKKKLAWIAQDLDVPCEEDVFSLIATLSEGSLRDAESLFDQIICYAEHPITSAKVSTTLGLTPQTVFFTLDKAFEEQNLSFAFELASDIFSSGKDLSYFIDQLIEHYRSLLKLKLYRAQEGFVNFGLCETKSNRSEAFRMRSPSLNGKGDEENRFGEVAASPNSQNLTERGIYRAQEGLMNSTFYTEEQCLYILDFLIHWQQQIGKTPFKRVTLEMILLHIIRSKHKVTLPLLVKRLIELEQIGKVAASPNLPSNPTSLLPPVTQPIERADPPSSQASMPSPLLLSKSQWEAVANPSVTSQTPPSVPEAPTPFKESTPSVQGASPSRYDTLIRFAAVELEGIIKKEQPNG